MTPGFHSGNFTVELGPENEVLIRHVPDDVVPLDPALIDEVNRDELKEASPRVSVRSQADSEPLQCLLH